MWDQPGNDSSWMFPTAQQDSQQFAGDPNVHHDYMSGADSEGSSEATDDDAIEAVDLRTYLTNVPEPLHGDALWHEFLIARRRWRSWSNKRPRFQRRVMRRRSRSFGGKGSSRFGNRRSGPYLEHDTAGLGTADPGSIYQDYFKHQKGRGKG